MVATNPAGDAASDAITVTVPSGTPPAAPTNPLVTNRTLTSLTLSWTDNSSDETGFVVEIATDRRFTQSVQSFTVGPDTAGYRFSPLAPKTRYYLRVASTNGAGNSTWSATVADMTK
ncbi:MAG: fibronectin type III domain-containing protein [Acidimicrobiales bacterium]